MNNRSILEWPERSRFPAWSFWYPHHTFTTLVFFSIAQLVSVLQLRFNQKVMTGLRVLLAEIRNVSYLLHLETYLSSGLQLSTEDKRSRFLWQLKKKFILFFSNGNVTHPGIYSLSQTLQMVTYFIRFMAKITRAVITGIYPSTLKSEPLQKYVWDPSECRRTVQILFLTPLGLCPVKNLKEATPNF